MNRVFSLVIVSGVGLLLAIMITVSALTGGGNSIGSLAKYLAFALPVFAFIYPKASLYVLIFLTAYSDLLKRSLVVEGAFDGLDITFVLAMAPLCLSGILANVMLVGLMQGRIRKCDVGCFCIATLITAFTMIRSLVDGGSILLTLKTVANQGFFAYALVVIPFLVRSFDDFRKLVVFILGVYVPVACYGVYQGAFGLSSFEIDYLLSGYSIEIRQLFEVKPRPFSTLNAATTLTIMMALCAMLVVYLKRLRVSAMVCFVLFVSAMLLTLTRMGWLVFAVGLVSMFMIQRPFGAFMLFGGSALSVVCLIVFSDFFLYRLGDWQEMLTGADSAHDVMAFRITTWSDRLIGFTNLKNPDNWRAFGVTGETFGQGRYDSTTFSHDGISSFIFKYGYIPFGVLIGTVTFAVVKGMKAMNRLPGALSTSAKAILGMLLGLSSAVLSAETIFVFPVNFFFWFLVSGIAITFNENRETEKTQDYTPEGSVDSGNAATLAPLGA